MKDRFIVITRGLKVLCGQSREKAEEIASYFGDSEIKIEQYDEAEDIKGTPQWTIAHANSLIWDQPRKGYRITHPYHEAMLKAFGAQKGVRRVGPNDCITVKVSGRKSRVRILNVR